MKLAAQRIQVSAGIRVAGSLPQPQYVDAFEVGTDAVHSPEAWARIAFEDAPRPMRWLLLAGWRYVLGLRLGPLRSPEYVLGWSIERATAEAATLAVRSVLLGRAEMLVQVKPGRVVLATFLRFDHRPAQAAWRIIGLIHRPTVRYLLSRAANQHG